MFAYMTGETLEEMKDSLKENNNKTSPAPDLINLVADNTTEDLADTVDDGAADESANRLEDHSDLIYELGLLNLPGSILT